MEPKRSDEDAEKMEEVRESARGLDDHELGGWIDEDDCFPPDEGYDQDEP